MLASAVLGLDLAALARLAEEFPVTDIKYDKVKPDGFKPRYIDWPQISKQAGPGLRRGLEL